MNPTRFGLAVATNIPLDNGLFINLKSEWQISKLEKQLTEKNFIINFLTTQFVTKPQDLPLNKNVSDGKHFKVANINNSNKDDYFLVQKLWIDDVVQNKHK